MNVLSLESYPAHISYSIPYFRACRLKKKQQHEANKVKLHGLQSEQGLSTIYIWENLCCNTIHYISCD